MLKHFRLYTEVTLFTRKNKILPLFFLVSYCSIMLLKRLSSLGIQVIHIMFPFVSQASWMPTISLFHGT